MTSYYPYIEENAPATPFDSSEEAWLWCCLCESLGHIKGRGGHRTITRPCESADILIATKKLLKTGKITHEHLQILSKYGLQQMPPHPNFGDSPRICRLWKDAMYFLENILKQKGIVA